MVQPAPSVLLLPDTFISPFLLEVFASGLGYHLGAPPRSPQQRSQTRLAGQALAAARWLCKGSVLFRGSSFKHPPVISGVQHI